MTSNRKNIFAAAVALATRAFQFGFGKSPKQNKLGKRMALNGPRDVNGNLLAVGDEVILRGTITSILIHKDWSGINQGGGNLCHFEIQTTQPQNIGSWPNPRFSGMTGDHLELVRPAAPTHPRSRCDWSPARVVEWDTTVKNPKWSAAGQSY